MVLSLAHQGGQSFGQVFHNLIRDSTNGAYYRLWGHGSLIYFRKPIEAGKLISGWKQVTVDLIGDDRTCLEIPNSFFELVLVDRDWVSL